MLLISQFDESIRETAASIKSCLSPVFITFKSFSLTPLAFIVMTVPFFCPSIIALPLPSMVRGFVITTGPRYTPDFRTMVEFSSALSIIGWRSMPCVILSCFAAALPNKRQSRQKNIPIYIFLGLIFLKMHGLKRF